jgi:hypothetical protein
MLQIPRFSLTHPASKSIDEAVSIITSLMHRYARKKDETPPVYYGSLSLTSHPFYPPLNQERNKDHLSPIPYPTPMGKRIGKKRSTPQQTNDMSHRSSSYGEV